MTTAEKGLAWLKLNGKVPHSFELQMSNGRLLELWEWFGEHYWRTDEWVFAATLPLCIFQWMSELSEGSLVQNLTYESAEDAIEEAAAAAGKAIESGEIEDVELHVKQKGIADNYSDYAKWVNAENENARVT